MATGSQYVLEGAVQHTFLNTLGISSPLDYVQWCSGPAQTFRTGYVPPHTAIYSDSRFKLFSYPSDEGTGSERMNSKILLEPEVFVVKHRVSSLIEECENY
jgi:hypothetical protein